MSNKEILKSRTLETFLRDYDIFVEIDEIRKDGVNMSKDNLGVPKSVENLLIYKDKTGILNEYTKNLYQNHLIRDLLIESYIPEYQYLNQKKDSILKVEDEFCFNFFRLKMEYEYKKYGL